MKRAFTLLELLLVIAIAIILVTLVVPGIIRARVIAIEMVALANVRILSKACQAYHIDSNTYPANLSDLIAPASSPPYIDSDLASGNKQRYQFIYQSQNADTFTINANPVSAGLLRGKYFYTDESGIIRANVTQAAGPNDEIVG